ncbi:hypothetical protein CPB86DRAFT_782728 [Serendipita vermifera]|nr:hypothetical protein CPB86DRAFT_782728 [Serendipita vermifera]
MSAKYNKKRNKSIGNANENNEENSPTNSIAKSILNAPSPSSDFAKIAEKIFTPDMSDIDKLQKLKEYILADQHPFFTSAPKVAHLLSLHASGSDYDRSTPSNENERPLSNIPLADRLSSPKPPVNPVNDFENTETASQNHVSQGEEHPFPIKSEEPEESSTSAGGRDRGDVEMSDTRVVEPTRSDSSPTRGEGVFPPQQSQNYSRPHDMQRRPERYSFGDNGRRSPRQGSREFNTWEDRRPPDNDSQPRYPSGQNNHPNHHNHRPGEQGHRYGQGHPRGGYHQHPNRRFSGSERPQFEQRYYENDRDRRPDYPLNSHDDRRPDDRFVQRQPHNGPRGYQNNNNRPYHDRRSENQSIGGAHHGSQQPMSRNNSEVMKPDEEMKTSPVDTPSAAASVVSKDNATSPMDTLTEKAITSPQSTDNLPLQSTTESTTTMVAPSSPVRSDVPMDSSSTRMGTDGKSSAHRSPAQNQDNKTRDQSSYRQNRQFYPRNDNNRTNQEGRPRADSYVNTSYYNENRFGAGNRGYDRPPPQRDDRAFSNMRDPGYKPPYNGATQVDDRRFVPREPLYPDEPPYTAKRDYRPADWDMRRREGDRFDNRSFDRERDREPRGPMMGATDSRTQKMPQQMPSRNYPADRDGSRPFVNRGPPDPYPLPPPSNDVRGYDRDFYVPPPQTSSTAPYTRDASRIRPRSLSPRRDYRPGDRPPNKRPRGPDDSYNMSGPPPGGHYMTPNYGPPPGRNPDFDRRPLPSGPNHGNYYRADDRGPNRY